MQAALLRFYALWQLTPLLSALEHVVVLLVRVTTAVQPRRANARMMPQRPDDNGGQAAYRQCPGGGLPGPRHLGAKTVKAVKRFMIIETRTMVGPTAIAPTRVENTSPATMPTAVRRNDRLLKAAIPATATNPA